LQNVITLQPGNGPFRACIRYVTRGVSCAASNLAAALAPACPLTISTAYTFVNAAERAPIVGDILQTFVIPKNHFSILASGQVTTHFLVTFESLLSGSYLAPNYGTTVTQVYRLDGLDRLNTGASYRIPIAEFRALRFFARAENLLDQAYFESGFPTPGRTGKAGAQFEF
jgi:outer membrane receptor protein involved in Fe transport